MPNITIVRERASLYSRFSVLLLLLCYGLCQTERAYSQDAVSVTQGPLGVRDQHPLGLLHSTFRPQDATVLAPNNFLFDVSFDWSNTSNFKDGSFVVDTETRVGDFFFRYGLAPGLELQLSQNVIWRGSGESDNLIEGFHRTFGIPIGRRKDLPKDQYAISGVNKDGSTFDFDRSGTGLGGLDTAFKYSPTSQSERDSWAILLGAGLPTGTDQFTHSGVDLQLALYGQAGIEELEFYSGAAIFDFTDPDSRNLDYEAPQYSGFLGAQYPYHSNYSLYLGAHAASILLKDVVGYPDYQTYLDIGVRARLSDSLAFNFDVRENVLHSQATTDITLMFGLTYLYAH